MFSFKLFDKLKQTKNININILPVLFVSVCLSCPKQLRKMIVDLDENC